jgi:hypothetical protein
MFIIASFLLSMSGCGHKANPYIEQEAPAEDENVKFVIEKKKFPVIENNVSCE